MVGSLCVLIRRAPYGLIHASEALRHMGGAVTEWLKVIAVFIDDGVYVVKEGQRTENTDWTSLSETLREIMGLSQKVKDKTKGVAGFFVHGPSLEARGLEAADLVPGVEIIDDGGLVQLLAEADGVMVY